MIYFKFILASFYNFKFDYFLMLLVSTFSSFLNMFATFSLIPLIYYLLYGSINFDILNNILVFFNKNHYSSFLNNITLETVLTFFFIFFFFSSFFKILADYLVATIRKKIMVDFKKKTLTKFFQAKWHFFYQIKINNIASTIYKDFDIMSSALISALHVFSNLGLLFFLIMTPLLISFHLTITIFIFSLILIIPIKYIQMHFFKMGFETSHQNRKFSKLFFDTIFFFKTVIINNHFKKNIKYLSNIYTNLFDLGIRGKIYHVSVHESVNFISVIVIMLSFFAANFLNVGIPELAAIMYAFLRLLPISFNTITNLNNISNSRASFEHINSIISKANFIKRKDGNIRFNTNFKKIIFKDVFYKYPDDTNALNGISLEIKKNQFVGLVGESGSGKSTILDLIMGLDKVQEGDILIDDKIIFNLRKKDYLKKVGYVDPNNHVLPMTIYDNFKLFNQNISLKFAYKILKVVSLHDFVNSLPRKIHTELSDHGYSVSAGQKQRICIARALIKKPKILILDEATSHLDHKTEKKVIENLKKLHDITIIFATHNKKLTKYFDKKFIIRNGKVHKYY